MKYFVTGATGFIGSNLIKQLSKEGHEVHALVRSLEKAKDLQMPGVKIFSGDVTDKESMRQGMSGVDGVFHVAGWYKIGVADKKTAESVNIDGTRNTLELMKELGIPKGVYTSSVVVHSNTHGKVVDESHHFEGKKFISLYEHTKIEAHRIAEQFIAEGLPLVIVMPGLVHGAGDTSALRETIINYLQGKLPAVPNLTGYCWDDIESAVNGHLLAMEKGTVGESYHICGEPHSTFEVLKIAEEITGIRAPKPISPKIMGAMSYFVKPFDKFMPAIYTSEGLRVIAGVTNYGSNAKAKAELGFNPRPFRDAWEETLRHEMKLLGMS